MFNENPLERDYRTEHESLEVLDGYKYAANYWIHMYPFKPFAGKCTNGAYEENWY